MRFAIAAAVLIAAFLTGCGRDEGDPGVNPADTTLLSDSLDSMAVADTTGMLPGPVRPEEKPQEASPAESQPNASDEDARRLEGRYLLVSVQGEKPPVAINEGPDCEMYLGEGALRILAGGRFRIETTTWERCNGERGNEQVLEAEGTVSRDGERIRFEATYDSIFGSASGTVRGDEIRVDVFSSEGGDQEVEWTFRR